MSKISTTIGLILLAAGSSTRMGQSKQLLKVKDEPLLLRAANVALQSGMHPVVIVLGSNEEEHRKIIEHLGVHITINQNWKSGMGGSLKVGLHYLLKHAPKTEAVIVTVCDQPLLTADHLKNLEKKYRETRRPLVSSNYSNTTGVPALFHKTLFSEILNLPDDEGAKKIIQLHSKDSLTIDFQDGAIDLDTPGDYSRFNR